MPPALESAPMLFTHGVISVAVTTCDPGRVIPN